MIKYYTYVTEPSLELLLKQKRRFNEEEVWKFISVAAYFVQLASNAKLSYYFEPISVVYCSGSFVIVDILHYSLSENSKYLSDDYKGKKFRQSLVSIYSIGMIAIEMLGVNIIGLKEKDMYSIMVEKIENLGVSDKLKQLIARMVAYEKENRIDKDQILKYFR